MILSTLKVTVISSRVVAGTSRDTGKPYRFVECEANVNLDNEVRGCKFNLPRELRGEAPAEALRPGQFDLEIGAYVNGKGQLSAGINKVRASVAAVKAAA
jgi:hypothetical protein